MINVVVKKKAKAAKIKIFPLRCPEDLYKKIKAVVPKDRSISRNAILISILEAAFSSDGVKLKIQEADHDDKRGGNSKGD